MKDIELSVVVTRIDEKPAKSTSSFFLLSSKIFVADPKKWASWLKQSFVITFVVMVVAWWLTVPAAVSMLP